MKNIFMFCLGINMVLFHNNMLSQINDFTKDADPQIFMQAQPGGWVKFGEQTNFPILSVFEMMPHAFGLTPGFEMKVKKNSTDEQGYTHVKYQQFYYGVPVKGGEFIIHGKNGRAASGNGKIYTPRVIRNSRNYTEGQALIEALLHVNASKYYWQDARKEASLRKSSKSVATTYFPKAEPFYIWEPQNAELILTYAFHIYTFDHGKSGRYYISAESGDVLRFDPAEYSCDQTTFLTNWYGTKTLWTNEDGGEYDLEDDCQDAIYGVYTVDGDMFTNPVNEWIGDWFGSAAQSLFSIKIAYLWFSIIFNRNGHDNDGGNLDITQGYVFPGNNFDNASYTYDPVGDDDIRVGLSTSSLRSDDWNTIDVLGHEFGHGITEYEAELVYAMESGALNESFSDIFGEWLENKELGSNNWLINYDRTMNGCPQPIRYMVDPSVQVSLPGACGNSGYPPQPNTYLGNFWISQVNCVPVGPPGGNDYCGVHTNSGVQNQMFYLLSVGSSGWNNGMTCHAPVNSGYFWSVTGIGINDATRIAYKVLCDYLGENSNYLDSRNAWVQAAENLFGVCSFQAIQTGKAWHAVGIGPPPAETLSLCNVSYGSAPATINTPDMIATELNCFVHVGPESSLVEFKSGSKVTFQDGFRAFTGANFKANTTECFFANY